VHIKTDGGDAAIGSLSGGNQQKVVIGKMLATDPEVILLDEPSRGIDIGAKAEVFKLLAERAKQGLARCLHHVGGRRMPQHRPPHHRHAARPHFGGIRS
jgi:ABC-type sugar transport system ATPase subunit